MYRTIIIISTAMLSVCAAIFTFWALTRAEAWLEGGGRGAGGLISIGVGGGRGTGDRIAGDDDSGDPLIINETYAEEAAVEIVMDAAPSAPENGESSDNSRLSGNTQPRTEQASAATRQSVRRQHVPPSGPSIPYMINNAPPRAPLFALTFDGGSFANAAGDILDTLASRNVKSTMFVTGEFIRKYPNVITKIAAEGHELGNHTHRHPRLTAYAENRTQSTLPNVDRQFVINELNGAARLLADRTGLRFAPFWRAPYGEYNQQICGWALEAGYLHIGWRPGRTWYQNLDTNDWVPDESSPAYRSPREVYDKIVNIAAQPGGLNGGIILMHLGTERKVRSQQVHTVVGMLIDTLREMGYEPVTVSELLYKTGIDVNAVALGE